MSSALPELHVPSSFLASSTIHEVDAPLETSFPVVNLTGAPFTPSVARESFESPVIPSESEARSSTSMADDPRDAEDDLFRNAEREILREAIADVLRDWARRSRDGLSTERDRRNRSPPTATSAVGTRVETERYSQYYADHGQPIPAFENGQSRVVQETSAVSDRRPWSRPAEITEPSRIVPRRRGARVATTSREPSPVASPRKRRRILTSIPHAQQRVGRSQVTVPRSNMSQACGNSPVRRLARNPFSSILKRNDAQTSEPTILAHPTQVSLSYTANRPSLIFVSQLLPQAFSKLKRFQVLQILRFHAPYVPTCVIMFPGSTSRPAGSKSIKFMGSLRDNPLTKLAHRTKLESRKSLGKEAMDVFHAQPPENDRGWPANKLPIEIFENVCQYLPRDNILAMRLVDREMDDKVSPALFQTVVVPFRGEIYGMMIGKPKPSMPVDIKGKGRARDDEPTDIDDYGLYGMDPKVRDVDHGMKVFEGWGRRIKHFGMSFEVDDESLYNPPMKTPFQHIESWWGDYRWPHTTYNRFESIESLEQTADETRCMTIAFSHIVNAIELGLSVDSRLGYLSGPDISDRAQIFKEKSKVFGKKYTLPGSEYFDRVKFWKTIAYQNRDLLGKLGLNKNTPGTWARLLQNFRTEGRATITRIIDDVTRQTPFARAVRTMLDSLEGINIGLEDDVEEQIREYQGDDEVDESAHVELDVIDGLLASNAQIPPEPPLIFNGVDIVASSTSEDTEQSQDDQFKDVPLNPQRLKKSQREWLLETEWAQRAFLSSYILAVIDNKTTFQNVRAFTIAKLSSRYVPNLNRRDIWEALPHLENLTILVSPDWRDVVKVHEDRVDTPSVLPSDATDKFLELLDKQVTLVHSLKYLVLGYIGGGEHATGLWGRNRHVLPAPVIRQAKGSSANLVNKVFDLPNLQHLTFSNCWFTSAILNGLVQHTKAQQLKTLVLDSVSLVAYGGYSGPVPMAAQRTTGPVPSEAETNVLNSFGLPVPSNTNRHPGGRLGMIQLAQNNRRLQQILNNAMHFPRPIVPFQLLQPVAYVPPVPIGGGHNPGPATHVPVTAAAAAAATAQAVHNSLAWLSIDPDDNTWARLIDSITPAETLAQKRHAHNGSQLDQEPESNLPGSLLRVEFVSCGYVKLPIQIFFEETRFQPCTVPRDPELRKRFHALENCMMHVDDVLMGQIIPFIKSDEVALLTRAFGMRLGWGDDPKKYHNLEDGQPKGGRGRFSGHLDKLPSASGASTSS